MSGDALDLDALAALVSDTRGDSRLIAQVLSAVPALIAAARERDQQFILARHALGALQAADEVLNQAAGLDADQADNLDYRDEVVLALRGERDAARAEVAALREAAHGLVDACDNLRPASRFVERLRVLTTGGDR